MPPPRPLIILLQWSFLQYIIHSWKLEESWLSFCSAWPYLLSEVFPCLSVFQWRHNYKLTDWQGGLPEDKLAINTFDEKQRQAGRQSFSRTRRTNRSCRITAAWMRTTLMRWDAVQLSRKVCDRPNAWFRWWCSKRLKGWWWWWWLPYFTLFNYYNYSLRYCWVQSTRLSHS